MKTSNMKISKKFYRKNNLEITEEYQTNQLSQKTILHPNGVKECEWYSNGILLEKYTERNYKKNGPYKKYDFLDGSLTEKGTYKNGYKDGLVTTYRSKKKRSEFVYREGVLESCTEFDGHPLCKYIYKKGEPQKIEYFDKEFKKADKRFKDGPYKLNREDGTVFEEGTCKKGFLFPKKRYYENKKIWRLYTYKKNGEIVEKSYDKKGQIEDIFTYVYQHKLIASEYYMDGELSSKNYKKGNLEIDEYYWKGQLSTKHILYPDGKRINESYYDGKLSTRDVERNYKRDGICQHYRSTDGTLSNEETYSKGKLIKGIYY